MGFSEIISRIFLRLRGEASPDLSRGPLSDRIRRKSVLRFLAGNNGRILEVGVGEGLVAGVMASQGRTRRMIGVDLSPQTLQAARRRVGDRMPFSVVCCRGDCLPFIEGKFSLVICINTLHNQGSWAEVVRMISAGCAQVGPGGRFVFDIRNGNDPLIRTAYRFSTLFDPTTKRLPVRTYRLKKVERVLNENGFRITGKARVRYPFWVLPSAYIIEATR